MVIGDVVYYVQRAWRRVVPGEIINADENKVVMLVDNKYTWIVMRKYVYTDYDSADKFLGEFTTEHGPLPLHGENFDG
jgi:hypothetical protein